MDQINILERIFEFLNDTKEYFVLRSVSLFWCDVLNYLIINKIDSVETNWFKFHQKVSLLENDPTWEKDDGVEIDTKCLHLWREYGVLQSVVEIKGCFWLMISDYVGLMYRTPFWNFDTSLLSKILTMDDEWTSLIILFDQWEKIAVVFQFTFKDMSLSWFNGSKVIDRCYEYHKYFVSDCLKCEKHVLYCDNDGETALTFEKYWINCYEYDVRLNDHNCSYPLVIHNFKNQWKFVQFDDFGVLVSKDLFAYRINCPASASCDEFLYPVFCNHRETFVWAKFSVKNQIPVIHLIKIITIK